MKDREVVFRKLSTPKRKETRNSPMTPRGNHGDEEKKGTKRKHETRTQPKKVK